MPVRLFRVVSMKYGLIFDGKVMVPECINEHAKKTDPQNHGSQTEAGNDFNIAA
ncbi:predicted protein [Pyrenophora tritici-repentis Pt-1C-BFP]|uniref:Uncharacterized protein n=1 Tax=Pyrenophora tritici-repentis (strain Pt-1C-BFP) TaxID=426418 RepID=B2VX31_PYRTR|nr:uncharacterized protein PTRG_00268 [Pyrenophora tritici-repentis Pt-1C-BFP]EDU39706.1 predicted protein [Pyrenophora tritici-repentis Pt-1C-BFP]